MRIEQAIGDRIRLRRRALGLSGTQLGAALGEHLGKPWTRQQISAAEAGHRAFPIAELVGFGKTMGVSLAWLIGIHGELTIDTTKAADALATLSEELAVIAAARLPDRRDEPGVPAELVVPDVDVAGLPSPEGDVDAPVEPEVAAPTAASGEPTPAGIHAAPGLADIDDPNYDPTRAEADELIAAGLSAHHIAHALDVPLETVRGWQKEAR